MGSLDVSSAKQQFFTLVDAISASHLPSFTIWLDAKLAEYKTIGQLKLDTEYETREKYPEWIAKALRQNLSFIFPGHTQTSPSSQNNVSQTVDDSVRSVRKRRLSGTSDTGSGEKRSKVTYDASDGDEPVAGEENLLMVIKEEAVGSRPCDTYLSRAADTPLPGITSTFSLAPELESNCALRQPAPVFFPTPSESHVTCSATSMTAYTAPHQLLSDSAPRAVFSVNSDINTNPMSETVMSESACAKVESIALFTPSVVPTMLQANPQLSASSHGEPPACSVTLPISAAPPVLEPVDRRGPSQTSQEAVQARDYMARQEPSSSSSSHKRDAPSNRKPRARKGKPAERRHACTACDAKFYHASELKRHRRSHTGERPFACSECTCKFTRRCHLLDHLKTHTGERLYASSECPANFALAGGLKIHMRTHTGERPYVCSDCSANLTQLNKLNFQRKLHRKPT